MGDLMARSERRKWVRRDGMKMGLGMGMGTGEWECGSGGREGPWG